jgi:nucleoside-diphosphate-sugar epimerase
MTRWLVTGATGFLGTALLRRLGNVFISDAQLSHQKCSPIGVCRHAPAFQSPHVEYVPIGDLCELMHSDLLRRALGRVDVVVHAAARVHKFNDSSSQSLNDFRAVNVDSTLDLARMASHCGVKRFIFISSAGVMGLSTDEGSPFTEESSPNPHNYYAQSKYLAEQGLISVSNETGLEIVVIRPPLVYGRNAPGNFASLVKIVSMGLPLPFRSVHNLRSFVSVENLADFIIRCGTNPLAGNQTFLVSDGYDMSTGTFISKISQALGLPVRLWGVDESFLRAFARISRTTDPMNKLCSNLQLDIGKALSLLDWAPPYSVDECLSHAFKDSEIDSP